MCMELQLEIEASILRESGCEHIREGLGRSDVLSFNSKMKF